MGLATTRQGEQTFYWRSAREIVQYNRFRISGAGGERREAKEIPVQEAANAICLILESQVGLRQEDLIREGARWMGYIRVSPAVTALMEGAIAWAQERGRITRAPNGNWIAG